jgi:hypothetical protein
MAHPTRAASKTCDKCNHWLCDECAVSFGGRLLCKSCINTMEPNYSEAEPASPHVRHSFVPHRRVNFGLLFLFSFIFPSGANYMYMGLIKRGLAAMCGFFLLIYLIVLFSFPFNILAAFAIPVYWITCFFDGFHIRRRINSGEIVEDGIGSILSGMLRNKTLTAIFLIIIAIAILGFLFEILKAAMPILLVIFALYLIFIRK